MDNKKNIFENEIRICHELNRGLGQDPYVDGMELFEAVCTQAYLAVSEEVLCHFVRSALEHLDENGLVNLYPDPVEPMPSDIRVGVIFCPSYAVTALAIYLKNRLGDEATAWMDAALIPMMNCAFKTGIVGHGYDAGDTVRRTLLMLSRAGAKDFIRSHGTYSLAFTACVTDLLLHMENRLAEDRSYLPCGNGDFPTTGDILGSWHGKAHAVFVYGTLLRRGSAAKMMSNSVYGGKALLSGFEMFDLGSFPGIVPCEGKKVLGEVFYVDDDTLQKMDGYEGEGSLYKRVRVSVKTEGRQVETFAYVYMHSVDGCRSITEWQPKDEEYVWYACYGSNLSSKRFECYLRGGRCEENGREYVGCRDKRNWQQSKIWHGPGRLYFGNNSSSWDGKGVAFYAPDKKGSVIMRLYKITRGQMLDIQRQEGPSDSWYGNLVLLDTDSEGIPAYTFTSKTLRPQNAPSEAYRELMLTALRKECATGKRAAEAYIKDCLCEIE